MVRFFCGLLEVQTIRIVIFCIACRLHILRPHPLQHLLSLLQLLPTISAPTLHFIRDFVILIRDLMDLSVEFVAEG